MRVTGGQARGIILSVPDGVEYLRPATDFMREAVFSSLGRLVQNAMILDVFAGVGGYGLDALSRGARGCVFVEKSRVAVSAIENNIKNVQKSAGRKFQTKVVCNDVFNWVTTLDIYFDLIFIDPPYNMTESRGNELLSAFAEHLNDTQNSRIVLESPGKFQIDTPKNLLFMKRLGRMSNTRQPNALIYGRNEI